MSSIEDLLKEDEAFDPNTSVLEDYLESITTLPAELKRAAVLLREVDARCASDLAILKKTQDEHLDAVSKKAANASELAALVMIHKKRLDTQLAEKDAIIQQMFDISQKHSSRLHKDIKNIQGLLRDTGELEESNMPDPFLPLDSLKRSPATTSSSAIPSYSMHTGATAITGAAPIPTGQTVTTTTTTSVAAASVTPVTTQRRSAQQAGHAAGFDPSKFPIGSFAAAYDPEQDLWILARILDHNMSNGTVTVADAENEANRMIRHPKNVIVLVENEDVAHARTRLGSGRNKPIHALYPDTTSFYPAVIVQPPFRCSTSDPDPTVAGKVCIACIFNDDEDITTGVAPKRIVPVRSVFASPGS